MILDGVPKSKLPAIESFEREEERLYWVNLKWGNQWSGQHAFGTATKGEALRMIRAVEPCDCEVCQTELARKRV